ncbi:hypothetical protein RFI_26116 [Reticulomyxa filosa]|uniref:Alpha-N-acetylglucosaminidase n=1 Tax=Reticulomyxa filosa TaxID=46433 RepID=X6MBK3_RETFI|nr:hypothetical protein RFI_26116 [Reticulomyxa filosa]|eukprot:ETO11259.1 hypothetical protein RFI_26116 [Reticulomyxa filosa]
MYVYNKVTKSPNWWDAPPQYCCVDLLSFSDPLFQQIGSTFIQLQTKYFGTAHIYQADTFNEMRPPNGTSAYLKKASSEVYAAMTATDPQAIWLMQGWLFQDTGFWTNTRIKAYLSGVPNTGMIILDLYSDEAPVYNRTESYFGKPFVWNTLHNFGGTDGLMGDLPSISEGIPGALVFPNSTVMGVGITMEGIWQNYIVYDLTLHMAWNSKVVNLTNFVSRYAMRRYGLPHSVLVTSPAMRDNVTNYILNGWRTLGSTVYTIMTVGHTLGIPKSVVEITPTLDLVKPARRRALFNYWMDGHGDNTSNPLFASNMLRETPVQDTWTTTLLYNPTVIHVAWRDFVRVGDTLSNISKFTYDLVDITRQAMSDLALIHYLNMTSYYKNGDADGVYNEGQTILELIDDMDDILNTHVNWLLGPWIASARGQSNNSSQKDLWEFNARNQITLWGPQGQISDYASKMWGGLVRSYYRPRWKMFVDMLVESVDNGTPWNETIYIDRVFNEFELPWQYSHDTFPVVPVNNTINLSCQLYLKWNFFGDTRCT